MAAPDRRATSHSDIVVELAGVCKMYRQRQRSERLARHRAQPVPPDRARGRGAARHRPADRRAARSSPTPGRTAPARARPSSCCSGLLAPDAGTVRALGMDPVRDRVRYVGRIGVVFGQRTELWWDHPVAASFEWKRVVWDIPRPRYERMLGLVRELLGLDEILRTPGARAQPRPAHARRPGAGAAARAGDPAPGRADARARRAGASATILAFIKRAEPRAAA